MYREVWRYEMMRGVWSAHWSADRFIYVIGQHNDQLINQLIVSWMWLVNVMISWLISWSISWLVEWTWLVSWLISWLVEWTWLVSWLDLPKFSRTCPNLPEFAQACFWAVAPVGEDDLWFWKGNLLSFLYKKSSFLNRFSWNLVWIFQMALNLKKTFEKDIWK